MASGRDRLAAMRAQREQGSFRNAASSEPQAQSYQQPAYAPPPQGNNNNYEMSGLSQAPVTMSQNGGGGAGVGGFMGEVASIQDLQRQFDAGIQQISSLHNQALQIMDPDAAQQHQARLDEQVGATRQLSTELKNRITALKSQPARGPEARIQKNQTELVNRKFVESLQNYQSVERDYRAKYRTRVERQFKLVKPDATPAEVDAVVNDTNGAGGQIFAQALTSSTRYSESRQAYREAQERHQEILRIEQNIAELAQLMNDMSVLVQQADEQLDNIEQNAQGVQQDMEQGNTQIDKAIVSARNARKLRWVCFIIIVVIVVIIAAILAWYFTVGPGKKPAA